MIYLIVGLVLICFAFAESIGLTKKYSWFLLLCGFVFLWLFVGLRSEVGTDWVAYYDFYRYKTDAVEVGYAFINNVFSDLGVNYNVFLLTINAFSLTLMYFFIRQNTNFGMLALLLYFIDLFLYFNFSGIRQGIAISITCFSVKYVVEKKFIPFLFLIFIASLFHFSALIFIIAYFLPREQFNKKQIIFMLIFFVGVFFSLNYFSELITLYTLKNADVYLNYHEKAENIQMLFYIGILKRFIIIFLVFFYRTSYFVKPIYTYFFNIYLFGIAIYLVSYLSSPDLGVRMSSYFIILDTIIAANLLSSLKTNVHKILVVFVFGLVAIYKLVSYIPDKFYLYKTIIS